MIHSEELRRKLIKMCTPRYMNNKKNNRISRFSHRAINYSCVGMQADQHINGHVHKALGRYVQKSIILHIQIVFFSCNCSLFLLEWSLFSLSSYLIIGPQLSSINSSLEEFFLGLFVFFFFCKIFLEILSWFCLPGG